VQRLGPRAGLLAGAAIVAGTAGFSWYMFTANGVLIDPSFPLIGSTLVYGAIVYFNFAITDADRRQVRRAFGHYVSPALLAEIEKTGDLKLGGEVRPLTVMFSDMRGFTPLSEILTPQRMLAVLNTLFSSLGQEIVTRYGTIDKFIGDAIMAFWNAPIDVPSHAHRACDAALAMRARLRALNESDAFAIRAEGRQIAIGIGISTGDALVGNMGLESRFDYSCIGDTVNTASRVESGTKELGYDILITGAVHDEARDMACLYGGALSLKGKSLREPVFLLVGDEAMAKTPAFNELAGVHAEAVALLRAGKPADDLIIRCAALGAKVDQSLAGFYALLSSRTEDFA
jgi:adenylate cyclase